MFLLFSSLLALLLLPCTRALAINPRESGFSVYKFLEAHNAQITPASRTIKFNKMATSPFIFYRGANHLYFRDWSNNAALKDFGNAATKTWIQGDLHIENFGSFHNDDGQVVYELNDFDEALVAPYQHDVWKLSTSLVLVARELNMTDKQAKGWIRTFVEAYRDQVMAFADSNDPSLPDKTSFTSDTTKGILKDFLSDMEGGKSMRVKMLDKWTVVDRKTGRRQFNISADLQPVDAATRATIVNRWRFYQCSLTSPLRNPVNRKNPNFFNILDVGVRLNAGTGSLGKNRYYVLIEGDSSDPSDDRILDVKQGGRPVPYEFLSPDDQLQYDVWFPLVRSEGVRHDAAYRAVADNTDDLLGYILLPVNAGTIKDDNWVHFVRERSPNKGTWEYLEDGTDDNLNFMSVWWGKVLATQHSRADAKFRDGLYVDVDFPRQFSKVAKGLKDEMVAQAQAIATGYADQVFADYKKFVAKQ